MIKCQERIDTFGKSCILRTPLFFPIFKTKSDRIAKHFMSLKYSGQNEIREWPELIKLVNKPATPANIRNVLFTCDKKSVLLRLL